jgi:hypothetical protein
MPSYKLAEMYGPGVNLLVVPISSDSGLETELQRREVRDELQARASSAGLSGTVILVWKKAFGDMEFLAPPDMHSAIANTSFEQIEAAVNTTLSWE